VATNRLSENGLTNLRSVTNAIVSIAPGCGGSESGIIDVADPSTIVGFTNSVAFDFAGQGGLGGKKHVLLGSETQAWFPSVG